MSDKEELIIRKKEENFDNSETTQNIKFDIFNDNSDDNISYSPSIGELMDEAEDTIHDSSDAHSVVSSGDKEDLDLLLKEGNMPLDEILPRYSDFIEAHKRKMSSHVPNDTVNQKKRYISRQNYDESISDYEDFISQITKKNVNIGPKFQVNVPDKPSLDYSTNPNDFEEVIYDPYAFDQPSFERFFEELQKIRPNIEIDDENVLSLYTKHYGNITTALLDYQILDEIEQIQHSPLTEWTADECLQLKHALLQFGKNFEMIHQFCYPERSIKSLVNTYYIWKKSPLYEDYLNEASLIMRKQEYTPELAWGQTLSETEQPVENNIDHGSNISEERSSNTQILMNGNDIN